MKGIKAILLVLAAAALVVPLKVVAGGIALAGMFNFTGVGFNGDEVKSIGDVVMEKTFGHPAMREFHTVIEGVKAKKQVVYAGLLSKITKADTGCGAGATSKEIVMTQKLWDPSAVKVWLQLCASDLEASLGVYATANGTKARDIINNSDELVAFLTSRITSAMLEDAYRIAWFNDKTHTNVGAGSGTEEIKVGVSTTDYVMINGFWKQIFAIVAADANRRVTITENAGANFAAQDNLSSTAARDYYKNLLTKADYRLQGAPDKIIISTMSLLNNYADYLESVGVEASFRRLESGFTTLQRRGVTIIGWDFWDRTIRADFQNGTKYFNPHRAVLTTPGNLQLGLDEAMGIEDLEMWYSQDTELNNFRGRYKVDAKIAEDYMVQVAY